LRGSIGDRSLMKLKSGESWVQEERERERKGNQALHNVRKETSKVSNFYS
jgi:hypothetical protein